MFKFLKNRKGFTLVELMIVITVIAILATISAISYTRIQTTARDSRRKENLHNISIGLQAYANDMSGAFPTATTNDAGGNYGVGARGTPNTGLLLLEPTYIPDKQTPVDPTNNTTYHYTYKSSATPNYALVVKLEAPVTAGSYWCVTNRDTGGSEVANEGACTAP